MCVIIVCGYTYAYTGQSLTPHLDIECLTNEMMSCYRLG